MSKDRKTQYLLTLFPGFKDHEEIATNGFVLMKSRHGTTKELQVTVYTAESINLLNPARQGKIYE